MPGKRIGLTVLLLWALAMLMGCGSAGKVVPLPGVYIPREPDKPLAHIEAEQRAVGYTLRFLDRIFEWGLAPKNAAAKQAADLMAETARSIGQPINPIPLQVAEEQKVVLPNYEVAELTAELRRLTAGYRQALDEFKAELEGVRKEEALRGPAGVLVQPWWQRIINRYLWLVIPVGILVLIGIFPPVGAGITFVLRGLWRFILSGFGRTPTATPVEALPQVVAGVQEYREYLKALKGNPENLITAKAALEYLDNQLEKAQNPSGSSIASPTERRVDRVKDALKEKP